MVDCHPTAELQYVQLACVYPHHVVRHGEKGHEDASTCHFRALPGRVSGFLVITPNCMEAVLLFVLIREKLILVRSICYANIKPSWNHAQIGFNVLVGIGQAGPLTLLVACVQFTAPHAFLSTATGMAFSARAIGGAFGSAVLDAIVNGHLASNYATSVGQAAVDAGLPRSSIPALLAAMAAGTTGGSSTGVDGATDAVWRAAVDESRWVYAKAYQLAWASVIPFVALATVAVAFLKGVKELMTDKVEATVERVGEKRNGEWEGA